MTSFDKAFEQVKQLTEKFHSNHPYYSSPTYQEAEARKDFIDKFFIALGWDVNHDEQHNPYEQEVKVEKGQKQAQATAQKRADYAFYTAPNFKDVKFFVEAKKPAVELKHPDNYFQTIRYGWNANTPIAILTDFEQFHIIDCRYKPDIRYVFNGQHKEYRFTDYTDKEKFAELYWLFSREAVLNNSLQKYADSLPKPKGKAVQKALFKGGYQAIDDSFLEYIDNIREELAKAFKKNDENLGSEALTEAVTRTIDRLVFIRFLEDKLIEPNNHVSEWRSWKDFIADCRRLDVKYNGVVFKEHPLLDKKGFAGAEEKMFLDICSDISNLNSPYDFNYIPIHILGSIYERFLGKVVVATDHRVRIEEKPEVRKAGGVYYTPKYIVDYIVKNTIGPCIENKTPKEIAALRFADIACGSGSFLIGVYDYLLDYHKKYYQKKYADRTEPIDARNEDFVNVEYKDKQWLLTLKMKQDILLNNIYGVDIDRQAVEVTQLSLFLKMLEEETTGSIQLILLSKVLPDLSKNIVCGNSLIGTDILTGQLFSFEEEMKLKPMDFEDTFPSIMKSGGFDAIVGNPPWGADFNDISLEYLKKKHKEIVVRMIDSFMYFVHKSHSLIKPNGHFGMILPDVLFYQIDNWKLREFLLNNTSISILLNLGDVFYKVIRPSAILAFKKVPVNDTTIEILNLTAQKDEKEIILNQKDSFSQTQQSLIKQIPNFLFVTESPEKYLLLNKLIKDNTRPLSDFIDDDGIQRGVSPDYKDAFIVSPKEINDFNLEKVKLKKILTGGKQVKRYYIEYPDLFIIYNRRDDNFNSTPNICKYIDRFKEKITCKEVKEKKHSIYALHRAREEKIFTKDEKILGVITEDEIIVTIDSHKTFATDGLYLFGVKNINSKFLVGILNSNLFVFLYRLISLESGRVLAQVKPTLISTLPIVDNPDKSLHDQLVHLVTQMLETKKQIASTKTEGDKDFLENKCKSLDRQIDRLVYQLYELTDEEIKIVEGN